MTNKNLINLACRWLDHHQSEYIQNSPVTNRIYVAGCCQTDLRYFLSRAAELFPDNDREIYEEEVLKKIKESE